VSDEEFKFPEWQRPLQDAILEFDRDCMLEKVQNIENLISERLRELSLSSNDHVEHAALKDALSILRILKREKLEFPG